MVARKNRISLSEFNGYLKAVLDLPFEVSDYSTRPMGLIKTVRLAQDSRLTAYDASYLALAVHKKKYPFSQGRSSSCFRRGSARIAFQVINM
jgi:predicted nucleic acid-binding protein